MDILSYLMGYKAGESAGGGSGGGSGGGDLPAGIYLTVPDEPAPCTYRYQRFKYNGELYAGANGGSGAGALRAIYKWNGSKWDTVVDSTTLNTVVGTSMDGVNFYVAEYNGKAYIAYSKKCFVFDGSTFESVADFPSSYYRVVSYNGKLYGCPSTSGSWCEWDDASSTWISTDSALTVKAYGAFVLNNALYYHNGTSLYKYENGSQTKVLTSPASGFFTFNGNIYTYTDSSSQPNKCWRLNLETGESIYVGDLPPATSTTYRWFSANIDETSFGLISYSSNNFCPYFVIRSIVEPTA